jgi:hypothetical protein
LPKTSSTPLQLFSRLPRPSRGIRDDQIATGATIHFVTAIGTAAVTLALSGGVTVATAASHGTIKACANNKTKPINERYADAHHFLNRWRTVAVSLGAACIAIATVGSITGAHSRPVL